MLKEHIKFSRAGRPGHRMGQGTGIERELIERLDEAADRLLFLSEVSRLLSTALTDRECFNRLLALVVPKMGDWGTLNIVNERGEVERVAVGTADPKKRLTLEEGLSRLPANLKDITGPGYVIAHGTSELVPHSPFANEEYLREIGHPEWIEPLRTLGVKSRITVPLIAHGRVFGALWLASSESGRIYTGRDLELAEEIATRAAYAAYKLMRYSQASQDVQRLQIEMEVREKYLSQLRHDVLSVLTGAQLSAQILQRTQDCDQKNDFARRIVEAIGKVTDIIHSTQEAVPTQFKPEAAS